MRTVSLRRFWLASAAAVALSGLLASSTQAGSINSLGSYGGKSGGGSYQSPSYDNSPPDLNFLPLPGPIKFIPPVEPPNNLCPSPVPAPATLWGCAALMSALGAFCLVRSKRQVVR